MDKTFGEELQVGVATLRSPNKDCEWCKKKLTYWSKVGVYGAQRFHIECFKTYLRKRIERYEKALARIEAETPEELKDA